jgi:hypothetical protein
MSCRYVLTGIFFFFFPIKLFIPFSYLYTGITSIEARGDYKSGEPPPRGDRLFKLVLLHFLLYQCDCELEQNGQTNRTFNHKKKNARYSRWRYFAD